MTAQPVSETRLKEQNELLRAIVDATPTAVICTDDVGLVKHFNPGAERLFGRSSESMQSQSLASLMPERFRANHPAYLRQFIASGVSGHRMGLGTVKGLRADGQEMDLEVVLSQVKVGQQRVLISHLSDASERLRTEAALQRTQEQLMVLRQQSLLQEKTLVKRLAQELHDQLGQTLAAIRMVHETIMTLQQGDLPTGVNRLQSQLGKHISQAIRQVRQVLVGLRPSLLDERGLAAALDNELRNRSLSKPSLALDLVVQPGVAAIRYPTEVEYAAFMVAREALENALKHADATAIILQLSGTAHGLNISLADNGTGMSPDASSRVGHLGILGMHERAHAVGGVVTLSPVEPSGTRVNFSWTDDSEVTAYDPSLSG